MYLLIDYQHFTQLIKKVDLNLCHQSFHSFCQNAIYHSLFLAFPPVFPFLTVSILQPL